MSFGRVRSRDAKVSFGSTISQHLRYGTPIFQVASRIPKSLNHQSIKLLRYYPSVQTSTRVVETGSGPAQIGSVWTSRWSRPNQVGLDQPPVKTDRRAGQTVRWSRPSLRGSDRARSRPNYRCLDPTSGPDRRNSAQTTSRGSQTMSVVR